MSNVLLGCAIGDALGVFAESKLSNYQILLDWDGKTFLGSEYHGLKPGQFSDDTQFSLCVAQSLIDSHGFNPDDLSLRYVELFDTNIIRGYGKTTLAAINNLRGGKHWSQSGIAGSYGNGTAMRAAPFGVYFRNDLKSLVEICKIDSAITHASPEAEAGSIAIAVAAYYLVNKDDTDLLVKIVSHLPDSDIKKRLSNLSELIYSPHITPTNALSILGTRCDVRQTVPSVLYCLLKYNNIYSGLHTIIRAGGDTDSNAAILGALYGARDGIKVFSDYHIKNVENSEEIMMLDSQLYNKNNGKYFPR